MKIENFVGGKFLKFLSSITFPGVMRGPLKNLDPISSVAFTFIGYKQTKKQTISPADKQSIYIDR